MKNRLYHIPGLALKVKFRDLWSKKPDFHGKRPASYPDETTNRTQSREYTPQQAENLSVPSLLLRTDGPDHREHPLDKPPVTGAEGEGVA